MGAAVTLESDWVLGLVGIVVTLFSALAWFVRQTVSNGVKELEGRIKSDLAEIHEHLRLLTTHLTDIGERMERVERQVDDTIIPKQTRIARKVGADDDPKE